jgi:hypothetical protein
MNQGRKDIIRIRVISTAFTVLALAVFKPFGLDMWQGQAYLHLMIIFVLGVMVCLLTDAVMKYILGMPVDMVDSRKDINYFIRRNLYFQIINNLLITLMICLYRHFVMSGPIPANQLSWSNFFETLVIIAFCSFAIGLYWRFKFRSRYLAEELEEMKLLNEQLKDLQAPPSNTPSATVPEAITLTGTTNETVSLQVSNLLYVEAVGNYVKVYHFREGTVSTDMLRATSKQIEDELREYPLIVRCHRAFLVNLSQVEQVVCKSGSMQLVMKHCPETIPVSRSKVSLIKEAILSKMKQ